MAAEQQSLVGIYAGRQTDDEMMQPARDMLRQFDVSYKEVVVNGAPIFEYGQHAGDRGIGVIIVASSPSSRLASETTRHADVPVITVPSQAESRALVEAIINSNRAFPSLTMVGTENMHNAALLAIQILAQKDVGLAQKMDAYKQELIEKVGSMQQVLRERGYMVWEHEAQSEHSEEFDKGPPVGVLMGSISDEPVMRGALRILDVLHIPYEVSVTSAHRTPDAMTAYAKQAKDRGVHVMIAGAGGAAHLPGMLAANSSLPVVGVPIRTRMLHGLTLFLSIREMPPGVPVATVQINDVAHAALFAAQILAQSDIELAERVNIYREEEAQRKEIDD